MNIEQQAAATLLDKGVKVRVTAPLLFRIFGRKTLGLVMTAPSQGTINRINDLFLSTGITDEQLQQIDEMNAHHLFKQFGPVMCQIIAVALLNSKRAGKWFGPVFGRWLVWHLTSMQVIAIINILVMLTTKEAFTNTIKSVSKMTTTKPARAPMTSLKSQGS